MPELGRPPRPWLDPPSLLQCRHGGAPHLIPRYSLRPIADLFTDEARFATWLEVEILAVEAWAELGVVPAEATPRPSGSGPASTSPRSRSASGSPTTTSPPSSTSSRSASARPRRWVHYGLTSSDVVDTALSRHAHPRLRPAARRGRRARGGAIAARAREYRDTPDGRADPRHPRRADDLRRQARAVGAAGAPRPAAAGAGPRAPSRSASSRARSARTPTSTPQVEALRVRAARAAAGAGHPGARARPPRRAALRVRVARRGGRVVRDSRSATSSAPRWARSRSRSARARRRARARCRTSATR